MRLQSIKYEEFEGGDQEWILEGLTLGSINLLVGKNATGKSRTLRVIVGLAQLLCGERSPAHFSTGKYEVHFQNGKDDLKYQFHFKDKQVLTESLTVNGDIKLQRGEGGEGTIYAERVNKGMDIEFQAPQDELAAFVRRDLKQHSFLEPLHIWASSVRHYEFGTSLGKENFAIQVKKGGLVADGKNASEIIGVFQRAKRDFQSTFADLVIKDMAKVDYPITEIGIKPPVSVQFEPIMSNDLVALFVRESGLKGITDQVGMSQGMFRVLSILILTNYLVCKQLPGCLIIDDIGEGLDFDRSCLLIDLLREKAKNNNIQLVVSTNDKFVMNRVPLEEWSILQRRGSHVSVLNSDNSKELFEDFRFTGLSNFSFIELNFANGAPVEELITHE